MSEKWKLDVLEMKRKCVSLIACVVMRVGSRGENNEKYAKAK